MANTRKSRVSKEEQLKLINKCRTSGMTDIDWCREHGIAVRTFYYWVKQLRMGTAQIPAPAYGHSENPRSKQDIVPIDNENWSDEQLAELAPWRGKLQTLKI